MLATQQMLQMPNAIARRGGKLFLLDKWADRGADDKPMSSVIQGFIAHWIVSTMKPGGEHENQSLGVITNGHSTLAGPLANFYLRWDGAIWLVAGGRANHGGVGVWKGYSGNSLFIGTEAEGPPFTDAQIEAYAILMCAVCDVIKKHPRDWAFSHQEYAPRRKIDIGDYIYTIREKAIQMYEGSIPPPVEAPKDSEEREEVDMLFAYDPTYGVYWAIPPDFASKSMIHPNDLDLAKTGWAALGLKTYGPMNLSRATLDRIPDVSAAKLTKVEGPVPADIVGDGVGNV